MGEEPSLVLTENVEEKCFSISPGVVRMWTLPKAPRGAWDEIAECGQRSGCLAVVGLQLLGLVMSDERIDDRLQTSLHD